MNSQHPQAAAVQRYRPLSELVPQHWQTGTVTTADNTGIHYTRTGSGKPPVLLLHGVQVSGLSWLRTAEALEATYDVIMPDFRGHGLSSRLASGATAETLVADTIALVKALELSNPFVIGHSMGADIAGRLAAASPSRAVILVEPAMQTFAAAALNDADEPPAWMQTILEALQALKTLPHAERMVAGLKLMPPGRPIKNESDYVTFIEGQAQFDINVLRFISEFGYLFEDTARIAQIACPALLLTARPMMPGANIEAGAAAFTQNLRDGRHIHFDDSGHAIMFDQFERFIAVVTDFLDECGPLD